MKRRELLDWAHILLHRWIFPTIFTLYLCQRYGSPQDEGTALDRAMNGNFSQHVVVTILGSTVFLFTAIRRKVRHYR